MTKRETDKLTIDRGLFHNVPRFLRTAVRGRLHDLETSDAEFDRAALHNRAQLKRLYALLHIEPSKRAQASLFGKAPAGSPLAALRTLASTTDARDAAEVVRRHRLPFLAVESAVGGLSEPVAEALVDTLDPIELVNRLPLLHRRGLLNGRVRDALVQRLRTLKSSKPGLEYRQAESVIRRAELDPEVAGLVMSLIDHATSLELSGDTAILVDASSSMPRIGSCLELAAQVACRIDAALDRDATLHVIAFALEAQALDVPRGSDLGVWRKSLSLPASDLKTGTSVGAAIAALPDDAPIRRVVIITDGYENRPPRLVTTIADRRARGGGVPALHLVQPDDAGPQLAIDLKNAQLAHDVFRVDRHFVGLDALVSQLTHQSTVDVFDAIRA